MSDDRYSQRRQTGRQSGTLNFDYVTGFLSSIRIGRLVIGWESSRTIIPFRIGGKNKAGLINRGSIEDKAQEIA